MFLNQLAIKHLRNIKSAKLAFNPHYNIFYGNNGSGKTSVLEAIYYLSLGRSFRTSVNSRIIQEEQDNLWIVGDLKTPTEQIKIGIHRHINGQRDIRLAGQRATKIALLAQALPLQLINQQQTALLSSPKTRREYLNWGLFHVEQSFFPSWQAYQLALKQRNAGLRQGMTQDQLKPWDNQLIKEALALDAMRSDYIKQLNEVFMPLWQTLIGSASPLQLNYYRGWSANKTLAQALAQNFDSDRRLGYTQSGIHRADMLLFVGKSPAKDKLSQGQQKILIYTLKLAQGKLLHAHTHKNCVYLIDDLPAELDSDKRANIAAVLNGLQAQVFLTGVFAKDMQDFTTQASTHTLFHVKQGVINNCSS